MDQHIPQTPSKVYSILPSTIAVTDYATGLRNQMAVFHWCSNCHKFVTTQTNQILLGCISHITLKMLMPAQIKPKLYELRCHQQFLFLSVVNVPVVYVYASTLCCFHSLSTQTLHKFYREHWQHGTLLGTFWQTDLWDRKYTFNSVAITKEFERVPES